MNFPTQSEHIRWLIRCATSKGKLRKDLGALPSECAKELLLIARATLDNNEAFDPSLARYIADAFTAICERSADPAMALGLGNKVGRPDQSAIGVAAVLILAERRGFESGDLHTTLDLILPKPGRRRREQIRKTHEPMVSLDDDYLWHLIVERAIPRMAETPDRDKFLRFISPK